ncbi:MAG: hypothetical protein ACXWUZ_03765 [Allosphingosinicella sp.]
MVTAAPAQTPAGSPREETPTELNARFLFSAYQARGVVKELGPAEKALADNFWTLATEFSEIVRRAEPKQQDLYVPLLASFQATLQEQVLVDGSADLETLRRIRTLLNEQVEIGRSLGSKPESSASVTATVFAVTDGRPRKGFYVWLDSPCCAPPDRSTQAISKTTNEATRTITRATYLIRIVGQQGVVGSREHFIGREMMPTDQIHVTIPATAR